MNEEPTKTASPFLSEGSPYLLLTAWYYGRLDREWKRERDTLGEQDQQLSLQRAGELAAAHLSCQLSDEYVKMIADASARAKEHEADPNYTDDLLQFYDTLVLGTTHPYFRRVLQDLSGTRTLLSDEQDYEAEQNIHPSAPEPPEEDPGLDYRVSPPVRAYPPVECPWTERESWGR